MPDEAFVVVARIVKTHGLKGEVSVVPTAETSFSALEGVAVWFVPPVLAVRSSRIRCSRSTAKGTLVTFEGVDGIDSARALVGREVLVDARSLPEDWWDEDEVTFDGYTVHDVAHGDLGIVVETIETGANDVWVVEGPLGEVLIPVIDDVVLRIDDQSRSIEVRLLPGLLPEETEST